MTQLLLHCGTERHTVELIEGQSVREALDQTAWRVRAACGGSGTCGACLVRWLAGPVTPPTLAEIVKLSPEERADGLRLACQMRLHGPTELRLELPAPASPWHSIAPSRLDLPSGQRPELQHHIYGVAVDLGSSQIRVALWDRKHGRRIASRCGANPQAAFGADILNRLALAVERPARALELAQLARRAIQQALRDMLAREVGEVAPMLAEIGQLLIVGNSAMLALLTGRGSSALVDPANWQRTIDYQPTDPVAWHAAWALPHADIVLPAALSGFVGSDLVADLIATDLQHGPAVSMLLDVGTNTEIALWDGSHLYATSASGGPAFEGVGIRHGMAAGYGAIRNVVADTAGGYRLDTIGGGAARGFCGSGLVDAVAVLLQGGQLKPSGRFASAPGVPGYWLDPANPRSAISGADIDLFQRAKAAIAAAMEQLLAQARRQWQDLRRLCLCGAFGQTLNISQAQALGLLPPIDPALIELRADASLAGCERALLWPNAAERFAALTTQIKTINLALLPDYEDRYIYHLRLRPISAARINPPA